jgi:hypothetical protein
VRIAATSHAETACPVEIEGHWMRLTRTSTIRHKSSDVSLKTPLLIPSFSSKGFARSKGDGKSEIGKILAASGEFLTEAYLISAYDIYYGDIPRPDDLPFTPDLIFLDSGGYEISTDRDYSSVIDPLPAPNDWDVEKLTSVLDAWPAQIPVVIVSYDNPDERHPFSDQVKAARKLVKKYPQHLHLLLLKPETKGQTLLDDTLKATMARASDLGSFDLVGATEKELGRSMLDRMAQIAKLRLAMDEADVTIPIHVFGSLDPLSACLYFLSGAEVFDGLTWIRYAFDDGRCVYTHNFGVLAYGVHERDDRVKARTLAGNYYKLQELQQRLRDFEATENFEKLGPHGQLLSDAFDSLKTRLKGRL